MIYKVTLNGKIYEVEVEQGEALVQKEYEAALPTAAPAPAAPIAAAPTSPAPAPAPAPTPAAAPASGGANDVKAPLPGNINAINVTSGQTVKAGQVLIILEAMKMENEIVSPKDGTIGKIYVAKGAVVQTGAPLVEVI